MKEIDRPLNPELQKILYGFSDWFFSQDLSLVKMNGKPDEKDYYTSLEYLETINKEKHIGYPEITHGIDMINSEGLPLSWRDPVVKANNDLNAYLGSKFCAVNMYYPAGGYMGWHNNHNCPGWNILLSYSPNGDGYFRYIEPITQKLVSLHDKPGWFAKVGYFGGNSEPDKLFWHCARAYSPRLTFGYVIPDEEIWTMMVSDL